MPASKSKQILLFLSNIWLTRAVLGNMEKTVSFIILSLALSLHSTRYSPMQNWNWTIWTQKKLPTAAAAENVWMPVPRKPLQMMVLYAVIGNNAHPHARENG